MKIFFSLLLFAELFFSQFNGLDIVNPILGGRPLSLYLQYLLFASCFLLMFYDIALKNKITLRNFIILASIAFGWSTSLVLGASFPRVIGESFNFILPLTVAAVVFYSNISVKTILRALFITCFIGGVLAFLVATRVVAVNIWASDLNLVRTAGAIDGTLGLVGAVAAIICIGNRDLVQSKLIWAMGLVGSVAIIAFGLSRLRFFILFSILILYVIDNIFSKYRFHKSFRTIAIFAGVILLFWLINPDIFSNIMGRMLERFQTLGDDGSTSVRSEEWRMHLQLLWDSYGFGQGWGSRQNHSIAGDLQVLYVHNIYTGLLMHGGIVVGGLYIFYLLKLFFNAAKKYVKPGQDKARNGLVAYEMFTLLLLGFGAAGITQAGAMFIMCIVYANQNEETLVYEKNRNLNLSQGC